MERKWLVVEYMWRILVGPCRRLGGSAARLGLAGRLGSARRLDNALHVARSGWLVLFCVFKLQMVITSSYELGFG